MQKNNKIHSLVLLAILLASGVILSRFFSIATPITKIGFAFVPLAISARYLGRNQAMIVAGIGDVIGAILFPIGVFFPGYSIVEALRGYIFYKFFHKDLKFRNIVLAVVISQILCTLVLNTLCMTIFYESFRAFSFAKYMGFFTTRIPQTVVMIVVETALIYPLFFKADTSFKKLLKK